MSIALKNVGQTHEDLEARSFSFGSAELPEERSDGRSLRLLRPVVQQLAWLLTELLGKVRRRPRLEERQVIAADVDDHDLASSPERAEELIVRLKIVEGDVEEGSRRGAREPGSWVGSEVVGRGGRRSRQRGDGVRGVPLGDADEKILEVLDADSSKRDEVGGEMAALHQRSSDGDLGDNVPLRLAALLAALLVVRHRVESLRLPSSSSLLAVRLLDVLETKKLLATGGAALPSATRAHPGTGEDGVQAGRAGRRRPFESEGDLVRLGDLGVRDFVLEDLDKARGDGRLDSVSVSCRERLVERLVDKVGNGVLAFDREKGGSESAVEGKVAHLLERAKADVLTPHAPAAYFVSFDAEGNWVGDALEALLLTSGVLRQARAELDGEAFLGGRADGRVEAVESIGRVGVADCR